MLTRLATGPRALTAGLALAGFVAIGLPEGALGVAWPSLRVTFGASLSGLGVILAVYTAGYLAASTASGRVMARAGTGMQLAGAAMVGTAGFTATAVAPTWEVLLGGGLLVGLAGGTFDAAINAHVALHYGVRSLGLLHAAYGVGATAAPLALTALLRSGGSWRVAYAGLVVFEVALAAGLLATRRDWDANGLGSAGAQDAGLIDTTTAARPRAAGLLVAMFFVAVGIEASAGQWAFSLFTESRGVSVGTAGLWTGAFWASLTAGRVALGVAGGRFHPDRILDGATAGIVAGACLLWWAPAPAVGALGLALVGFAEALVFPTLVAVTPARVCARRAPAVIGYEVAGAAVGAAALPALVGAVAEAASLEVLAPVLAGAGVVLIALHRAAIGRATGRTVTGPGARDRPAAGSVL